MHFKNFSVIITSLSDFNSHRNFLLNYFQVGQRE